MPAKGLMDRVLGAIPILFAVSAPQIMRGFGRLYRGSGITDAGTDVGSIRPDPISSWFGVVGFAAVGLVGLGLAFMGRLVLGLSTLAVSAPLLLMMLPSIRAASVVRWDEDGIEGPRRTWWLTVGSQRTFIRWQELVAAGMTPTQYWFVQAEDGRRVYWAYMYPGWGALTAALYRKCSGLELPPDMHLPGGPPRV